LRRRSRPARARGRCVRPRPGPQSLLQDPLRLCSRHGATAQVMVAAAPALAGARPGVRTLLEVPLASLLGVLTARILARSPARNKAASVPARCSVQKAIAGLRSSTPSRWCSKRRPRAAHRGPRAGRCAQERRHRDMSLSRRHPRHLARSVARPGSQVPGARVRDGEGGKESRPPRCACAEPAGEPGAAARSETPGRHCPPRRRATRYAYLCALIYPYGAALSVDTARRM
jgi:hypothetical protein